MLGFIDSADSHLMSTRSCGACSLHSSHRHALEEIRKVPISKRQILCLIALAYGNFCVAACVSLQAPFFPAECDNKGVSSQVYGLIFGIYELVILTASPIFGKMVIKIQFYSSPTTWDFCLFSFSSLMFLPISSSNLVFFSPVSPRCFSGKESNNHLHHDHDSELTQF